MESWALKGPYFTIPVAPWHKQFVYLKREGKFYQFCCLPNGLSPAPRIFSKILKPLFSFFRSINHKSSAYTDAIWLQRQALEKFGFIINYETSSLTS